MASAVCLQPAQDQAARQPIRPLGYWVAPSRMPVSGVPWDGLWDVRDEGGRLVYSGCDPLAVMLWIERALRDAITASL